MINWDPLEEVEEWWDSMDIASKKTIAQILKVKLYKNQWKLQDWEAVVDYYIKNELGDPKGYKKT